MLFNHKQHCPLPPPPNFANLAAKFNLLPNSFWICLFPIFCQLALLRNVVIFSKFFIFPQRFASYIIWEIPQHHHVNNQHIAIAQFFLLQEFPSKQHTDNCKHWDRHQGLAKCQRPWLQVGLTKVITSKNCQKLVVWLFCHYSMKAGIFCRSQNTCHCCFSVTLNGFFLVRWRDPRLHITNVKVKICT